MRERGARRMEGAMMTDVELLEALAVRSGCPKRYARYMGVPWNEQWCRLPPGISSWRGAPWALTLYGKPGTGKSHAAALVLRRYLEGSVSKGQTSDLGVRWFYLPEVLEAVKAGFDRDPEDPARRRAEQIKAAAVGVRLAIFDDLGAEVGEWGFALAQYWLEVRHSRSAATVVTTNALSYDELRRKMPRVASRLSEGVDGGFFIHFDGPDRRSVAHSQHAEEVF